MRQIGTIADEKQVQRLTDYLLTLGIRIQVEPGQSDYSVWAIDEDQVLRARDELQRFIQNPDDERYAAAENEARRLRDELLRKEKERQKNVIDVRRKWSSPTGNPFTILLIAISCVVAIASGFGEDIQNPVIQKLMIASIGPDGRYFLVFKGASEVLHGQVWRLLTPIFIHFGPMHLLMNMMATYNLGSAIERRRGSWRLAAMVLLIALVSNLAQYAWSGTGFGGMSGVAFGLFGYVWMKSEFDPDLGIFMPSSSVVMMLGFLVLCMTGLIGPIANAAHIGGLVVGVGLGYGPVLRRRIFRRR
jgi:GlpG protein